ncbi:hypothetical protein ACH5RR_041574 [Cinchona calisaya]|uniref:Bromo-adjacent domain-containing protein n=1 Tax=Cinchona calisaya TaxID=153742 RepID=A0ABD2XZ72_9GENT
MELDFDKYCVVDGSPTTVLPSTRRRSKVEKRKSKAYPRYANELLGMNEDFTGISFHHYRSISCKSTSARADPLEYDEVRKRGSVYQSSKEVRLMRKTGVAEGRKKIEFSQSSATALSFGIVDSLCKSDDESSQVEQKRSSVMSKNSDLSEATISKPQVELSSHDLLDLSFQPVQIRGVPSDGCSELSFESDSRDTQCTENVGRQSLQDPKFKSKPLLVPLSYGNRLLGKDSVVPFHKSLSSKLALPHSPVRSESDSSRTSSSKSRFGPVRKVFDPFVKSKLQRSPLSSAVEPQVENPTGLVTFSRVKTSLLHDFSDMGQHMIESCSVKENYNKLVQSTPAHLNGILKLDRKQGVPLFEFSVKFPEDIFVARTWKADNALNWTYTFHSVKERRKSNASGRGLKETHKGSSMVAQMQVSCYLCAELKDPGAFDNSMVTEFVLYDTAHPRKSGSSQDNSSCLIDVAKAPKASEENSLQGTQNLDEVSVKTKIKGQPKYGCDSGRSKPSTSNPLAAAELHPHLQIGAIVVQVPYEKRESLKFKSSDKKIDQPLLSFLDNSGVEHRKEHIPDCSSPVKVNVVIPSGNHSLPTTESHGPSPLLDRWRLGGGCDCGGWDMACPLNVLGNPNVQIAEDHLMDDQHPLKLFVQGKKDNTPALTMAVMEDEQFAVDFHAQLSTLQAFAICIAVWHTMESSVNMRQEENMHLLQSNSLRVFIEEEVKSLIDAVTEEEKCKDKRRTEEVLSSFKINPPFSPIARV